LATVADSEALAAKVATLFADSDDRIRFGHNALAVVEANRGALERVTDGVLAKLAGPSRDACRDAY
jgi:3-deoxy-D-manno-octulosonic-acid transferase